MVAILSRWVVPQARMKVANRPNIQPNSMSWRNLTNRSSTKGIEK